MKQLRPNEGLRIFDIKWEVTTAGPSPNANKRIEVFLLGCNKAILGNPCKGCFNSPLWDPNIATISRDPIEVANLLNDKCENNKYVTIGGGEPLEQLDNLIILCKQLKAYGFHIIVYTHYLLKDIYYKTNIQILCDNIDILIDGEFKEEEKLYDITSNNTARNFIGSGNQILWLLDTTYIKGYALRDINNITLSNNNILSIDIKDGDNIHEL